MSARGFIFASRQSTSGLKRYVLKVPIPELGQFAIPRVSSFEARR
jgi:hypothetical protein